MFRTAKGRVKPDLRGALHRKTARGRSFCNIRCDIIYKRLSRESKVRNRALSEWENYYPDGKSSSLYLDSKTKSREPFFLSIPDKFILKVITFPPTFILTFGILFALRDIIDPNDADGFAVAILCIFMLLNGVFTKGAYYIYEKPRFERARRKFKDEHPSLAQELWPEKAGET